MAIAGVAAAELVAEAVGDTAVEVVPDADVVAVVPHAFVFPNDNPATTQGVVSELSWIALPGGCVMAIVAADVPGAGIAVEAVVVAGLAALADGVELAVVDAAAAVPPELLVEPALAGASAVNAVATSDEER
jgi:hypothetical protein